MRYYWLFLFPLFAIVVVILIALLQHRQRKLQKKKKTNAALIAHTKQIRELPEYKAARKRYNVMLGIAALLFLTTVGSFTALAARPVSIEETKSELLNRDIMLCLDVSGSMGSYTRDLLTYFESLIDDMQGQRIGITIFDGIYVTISPLSDDYDSIIESINSLKDPANRYGSALGNVAMNLSKYSSSEIGPGLVGCVEGFDRLGEAERARSIIIATDNFASSTQAIDIKQAALYAKSYDITVYGVDVNSYKYAPDATEFREAALLTGGSYYTFRGEEVYSISEIVTQIMAQEAARFEGAGELIRRDVPQVATIVSLVSLVLFVVVIWRLKL